jgi:hypothetical protein
VRELAIVDFLQVRLHRFADHISTLCYPLGQRNFPSSFGVWRGT